MIYGLNFNNTPIPEHLTNPALFKKELGWIRGCRLQGVCNTEEELRAMVITASNNPRTIVTYGGPRKRKGEIWYAIYCG